MLTLIGWIQTKNKYRNIHEVVISAKITEDKGEERDRGRNDEEGAETP